jgi:hypothetical protein
MTFSKTVNQTVIKAVKVRLETMLANKEAQFQAWKERNEHICTKTRAKEVRRHFEKTIQAYKIIIYDLTPYFERNHDVPIFFKRKK